MRITQGTFSYLPDLNDEEIAAQVQYCLDHDWPLAIEHTDDPHPRNVYWETWGLPLFDMVDPAAVLDEIRSCRQTFGDQYIRVIGYDRSLGRATAVLSFIVNRPSAEPGFRLERTEGSDRQIRYTIHPYGIERPPANGHR